MHGCLTLVDRYVSLCKNKLEKFAVPFSPILLDRGANVNKVEGFLSTLLGAIMLDCIASHCNAY